LSEHLALELSTSATPHILSTIVRIQVENPDGRPLPIDPRGEADPPERTISNLKKGPSMGAEEEMARTSAIGTIPNPGMYWKIRLNSLANTHSLIRTTLPIDDEFDFRASEEVVDVPVEPLHILEVTF
jgi:hypothetical protein